MTPEHQQPDPTVNKESIPAEQPIAASPGPQVEQKPRSAWRSGWPYLFVVLTLLVVLGALRMRGH